MAYNDYGVLIKKNKKIVLEHNDCIKINGLNIRFCYRNIIVGNNKDYHNDLWLCDLESYTNRYPYKKYRMKKEVNDIKINSKRLDDYRYYTIISYHNDLYEIIHGYGIDCNLELVYCITNKLMNKLNRFICKQI